MTSHPSPELVARAAAIRRAALQFLPLIVLALLVVSLLPTSHAFASAAAGGGFEYEGWLTKLRNSVTGPIAFSASIISMVGTGAMLIFQGGELNTFFRAVIYFILVVSFVVGAQNVMSGILGHGALVTRDVLEPVWCSAPRLASGAV